MMYYVLVKWGGGGCTGEVVQVGNGGTIKLPTARRLINEVKQIYTHTTHCNTSKCRQPILICSNRFKSKEDSTLLQQYYARMPRPGMRKTRDTNKTLI